MICLCRFVLRVAANIIFLFGHLLYNDMYYPTSDKLWDVGSFVFSF